VERVLADFREWLTNLPAVEAAAPPPAEPVDLATVVGQFVALRHEVNLQTKASRAALEQNAAVLQQLEEAVAELRERPEEGADDELTKPLLKALIDAYDALALARRQVERQRELIDAALAPLRTGVEIEPPLVTAARPGLWGRIFGGASDDPAAAWREGALRTIKERDGRARAAADYLRQTLDGLLTGYAMGLARIERALPPFGVEPLPCAGRRFDPEQMEVVEVVAGTGHPSGEVVEEVRRGYTRDGAVFRFAQVKVAK
jgi:molecular chaperone GrpE